MDGWHIIFDARARLASLKAGGRELVDRATIGTLNASSELTHFAFRHMRPGAVDLVVDHHIRRLKDSRSDALKQALLIMIGNAGFASPEQATKRFSFVSQRAAYEQSPEVRRLAETILNGWREAIEGLPVTNGASSERPAERGATAGYNARGETTPSPSRPPRRDRRRKAALTRRNQH